jgi:hypothetical protein
MNVSIAKGFTVLAAITLLSCAQTRPEADPLITSSHDLFTQISGLILRSADKIPDNLWSYKPTPEVRTIGQLFAHIADASNHICALAVDGKPSAVSVEKTAGTKADHADERNRAAIERAAGEVKNNGHKVAIIAVARANARAG